MMMKKERVNMVKQGGSRYVRLPPSLAKFVEALRDSFISGEGGESDHDLDAYHGNAVLFMPNLNLIPERDRFSFLSRVIDEMEWIIQSLERLKAEEEKKMFHRLLEMEVE